jgi:hypothetical protein
MFVGLRTLYYLEHRMETDGRQRTRKAYRIVVRTEIGERFATAFDGMDVRISEGQTIISGEVVDQSQLYGILDRINALGLELVSLHPLPGELAGGARLGGIRVGKERARRQGSERREAEQR